METRAKSSASVRYVVALFLCMLVTLFAFLVSSFSAFLFFLSTFRFHVLRIILVGFFDFMFVLFVSSFCVHCMRFFYIFTPNALSVLCLPGGGGGWVG